MKGAPATMENRRPPQTGSGRGGSSKKPHGAAGLLLIPYRTFSLDSGNRLPRNRRSAFESVRCFHPAFNFGLNIRDREVSFS